MTLKPTAIEDAAGSVRVRAAIAPVHWLRERLWPESGAVSPIPALDGLRALAVILVILFHSWSDIPDGGGLFIASDNPNPLSAGRTGVQLFFVLSGFLLFLPYARWLFDLQARPSARLFYKRRLLRVGPAYWASLAILLVALGTLTPAVLADALLHVAFLSNVTQGTASTFNTVYWTMAVEVQFYATLPLLGWLVWWIGRRAGPAVAAGVVVGSLELISVASEGIATLNQRAQILPFDATGLVGTFSLSSWLGVFGAGIACSILYTYLTRVRRVAPARLDGGPDVHSRTRALATVAFVLGLGAALALACVPLLHQLLLKWLLFGWAYAGMLLGVLLGAPALRRPFASAPLRFIGLVSYSIYLWHSILLQQLERVLPPLGNPALHVVVRFVLGTLVSVAVAYVAYQLVERPFMRARKRAHEGMSSSVAHPNPVAAP